MKRENISSFLQTVETFVQRVRKALTEGDRIPSKAMKKQDGRHNDYNTFFFFREQFEKLKDDVEEITEREFC